MPLTFLYSGTVGIAGNHCPHVNLARNDKSIMRAGEKGNEIQSENATNKDYYHEKKEQFISVLHQQQQQQQISQWHEPINCQTKQWLDNNGAAHF